DIQIEARRDTDSSGARVSTLNGVDLTTVATASFSNVSVAYSDPGTKAYADDNLTISASVGKSASLDSAGDTTLASYGATSSDAQATAKSGSLVAAGVVYGIASDEIANKVSVGSSDQLSAS